MKTITLAVISLLLNSSFCNLSKETREPKDGSQILTPIAEQSNSSAIDYNDFKDSYFDNLTENIGKNINNSCGYVALGMLLSYYDTYLDDNIINDKYDVQSNITKNLNSPGIKNEGKLISSGNSAQILNEELNLKDQYFQAKLIDISNQLNYINTNNEPSTLFVTDFSKRKNILKEYLYQELNMIEGIDYDFSSCSLYESDVSKSNLVKEFIISEIRAGNPVLIAMGDKTGLGHAAIAYHYDPYTKNVVCNMGYGYNSTHKTIYEIGYSYYKTALSIHFKNHKHSHSDNYIIQKDNETTSCCYDDPSLDLRINDCLHTCDSVTYDSSFTYLDDKVHGFICSKCNKKVYENHSYNSVFRSNNHTYGNCSKCGHTVLIS